MYVICHFFFVCEFFVCFSCVFFVFVFMFFFCWNSCVAVVESPLLSMCVTCYGLCVFICVRAGVFFYAKSQSLEIQNMQGKTKKIKSQQKKHKSQTKTQTCMVKSILNQKTKSKKKAKKKHKKRKK